MRHSPNQVTIAAGLMAGGLFLTGCGSSESAPDRPAASTATGVTEPLPTTPVPSESLPTAVEPVKVTQSGPKFQPGYAVGVYMPTWLEDAENKHMDDLVGIDKAYIAFATPDADAKVSIEPLSGSAISAFRNIGKSATKGVYLSLGGYGGSDAQHDAILKGFEKGFQEPEQFANEIATQVQDVMAQTGIKRMGVDIDYEYPNTEQAAKLPELVNALHANGVTDIAMAVAAKGENAIGVQSVAKRLAELGVSFNVMTYDMNGPSWSTKSGPVTTNEFTKTSIDEWVAATGDASKVNVGVATYCYNYVGSKKSGDAFDQVSSVQQASDGPLQFKDLPPSSIIEDDDEGSTSARTKDGWAACQSPKRASNIARGLLKKYPDLGGTFLWEARGANGDYINALKKL